MAKLFYINHSPFILLLLHLYYIKEGIIFRERIIGEGRIGERIFGERIFGEGIIGERIIGERILLEKKEKKEQTKVYDHVELVHTWSKKLKGEANESELNVYLRF